MNLESIKTVATSKFARQVLVTQKHSPKILFVAGAVGVVGTVVLACRATLKVSEKLDVHENLEKVVRNANYGKDESLLNRELRKLQVKTGLEITKLYAPAVALGLVSIGALTGSHVVLTKRNTALMATYAGLDRAFKEYRHRVADEYGTDVDRKFAMGADTVLVEEKMADGTTKTTSKDVVDKNGKAVSPYAALFDAKSARFTTEPGMNANIIGMQQSWANDKLKVKGHLFLNEVYDLLDLPRTKAGAIVGWVYNPNDTNHEGDNYVSFGVFDNDPEFVESFLDGHEKAIWLDFNVDGIIYDKI